MMTLTDFIKDKEILHAENPNEAREWANKIRDNIKGKAEENLVSVSAEGFRVIIALKNSTIHKRKSPAFA